MKILIKSESESDPRYGCNPYQRPIDEYIKKGIIIIDKPPGPTSHQVVSWVKEILAIKKAGHSGTLDPKVTGVLPIGLMNSTKILKILLTSGKEYVTLMQIHSDVPEERLIKTLKYFNGEIFQTPPVKSSVKRRLRKRRIYDIEIIEVEGRNILFRVDCESGTYIRKLCHDIGLVLGTGAHMKELRRIRSGPFNEDMAITLHDLKDAVEFYKDDKDESHLRNIIFPMEKGIEHLKKIWVNDNAVDALCHGADLFAPGISKIEDDIQMNSDVAILTLKNELIALGKSLYTSTEIMNMERGRVVDLERVIMKPGTYPKKWG
ncbi:MAG: RNA-guided pseudouridylation complex pseudouridine synthase subunit Cbf5 [Candidatus Altiarchaeales archaeon]|nr:MAG: RNA-guided pseudouridylation complex pseudouridine synthase subunit Cbf5 [Candidatus Altiarchaeales archaeon]